MTSGKDSSKSSSALASASESLRQYLGRYFRRHVRDATEVEDLVQDVFTRIISRDSTEPVEHLGPYALQTARSVLQDRARRGIARHDTAHVEFDPNQHFELEIGPDRILAGRADLKTALTALLALPERTRTIFLLYRLEGLRRKEIAVRLGVSVSAVEKHLARAVDHLAETFGDPS